MSIYIWLSEFSVLVCCMSPFLTFLFRLAIQRSPRKSIHAASLQLKIPRSTVHHVLHKRLHLGAFKIQMIYPLKPSDQVAHTNFAVDMLKSIDVPPDFLRQVCFSGEATFNVNGDVNRYDCGIWGSQNPHVTCGSTKVNVWVGLMHKLTGPFFFSEKTVTGRLYLNMRCPQLPPQTVLQQPHFCHHIRSLLDRVMAGR
jgi:hypothetical protein